MYYERDAFTENGLEYQCLKFVSECHAGEFLVNLTPHDITMVINGEQIVVPKSGQVARCKQTTIRTGRTFCGFPVSRNEYGEVEGLPDYYEGFGYLVSGLVKSRVPDRSDVFAPSETIRNAEGQVAGATSLGE